MNPLKNENDLVRRIERRFQSAKPKVARIGRGDDAALFSSRTGCETVLTCDWFLEGLHFLRKKHPPAAVGWKCLARAVSDIAAMGGTPRCFLLSLALPARLTGNWFEGFLRGLRRASSSLRCELAGGDTTHHEKVLIAVTVIGEVQRGRALLRSGARAGDSIFVSGTLGEADAGLRELSKRKGMVPGMSATRSKHLYPEPRLELGAWLATRGLASAAMDVSDGLSSDLPRLCGASNVGARIDVTQLPVSRDVRTEVAWNLALHGGDDYELLFTVARKHLARVPRSFNGLRLTRIGEITREKQIVVVRDGRTQKLVAGGWDPFRR